MTKRRPARWIDEAELRLPAYDRHVMDIGKVVHGMYETTMRGLLVRAYAPIGSLDGLVDIHLERMPRRGDPGGGSVFNESGRFMRLLPAGIETWCDHDTPGRNTTTLVEELREVLVPSDPYFDIWALCMEMGQSARNSLVHSMPAYDVSPGELTGYKSPSKDRDILEVSVDTNKYAATQVLLFARVGIPMLTLINVQRGSPDLHRAWSDATHAMLEMQSGAIEQHMMPNFRHLPELSRKLALAIARMNDSLNSPSSSRILGAIRDLARCETLAWGCQFFR